VITIKHKQYKKGLQIVEFTDNVIKMVSTNCNKCSNNKTCITKHFLLMLGMEMMKDYIGDL